MDLGKVFDSHGATTSNKDNAIKLGVFNDGRMVDGGCETCANKHD
jgi:hypothetical protein